VGSSIPGRCPSARLPRKKDTRGLKSSMNRGGVKSARVCGEGGPHHSFLGPASLDKRKRCNKNVKERAVGGKGLLVGAAAVPGGKGRPRPKENSDGPPLKNCANPPPFGQQNIAVCLQSYPQNHYRKKKAGLPLLAFRFFPKEIPCTQPDALYRVKSNGNRELEAHTLLKATEVRLGNTS